MKIINALDIIHRLRKIILEICYILFTNRIKLILSLHYNNKFNIKIQDIYNLKYLLKTSLIILIIAESACILITAEMIGIVFYNYSIVSQF